MEKENENEEEESVREVSETRKDREETEVRSPLTMKQSTPSVADKRASTRLKGPITKTCTLYVYVYCTSFASSVDSVRKHVLFYTANILQDAYKIAYSAFKGTIVLHHSIQAGCGKTEEGK
eukprot:g7094.t1